VVLVEPPEDPEPELPDPLDELPEDEDPDDDEPDDPLDEGFLVVFGLEVALVVDDALADGVLEAEALADGALLGAAEVELLTLALADGPAAIKPPVGAALAAPMEYATPRIPRPKAPATY